MSAIISHFARRGCLMRARVLCCLAALISVPSAGWAKPGLGSGRLEGTVLDSSGASVGGATVTVQNNATGSVSTQVTDSGGHFIFVYLTPGRLPRHRGEHQAVR